MKHSTIIAPIAAVFAVALHIQTEGGTMNAATAPNEAPSDRPADVTIHIDGIPRNTKPFADCVMRGDLMHSFRSFHDRKRGRVAYMGGSVTMRRWREGVQTWLRQQFPGTTFDFIMAGVGGTPAELGAFRVQADVLKNGPVDLFFLEFAVNGGTVAQMEGIVRQVKAANPDVDIVMMYFASREHMGAFNRGNIPAIVVEHEKVAQHYNIPALYLYREIARRVADGRIEWGDFARDNMHPNTTGSDMYAACIVDFLEAAWRAPRTPAKPRRKFPRKLDPDCLDDGGFVPYASYRNAKGFRLVKEWKHPERVINIVLPTPLWEATEPGSELTIDFDGTTVGLYLMNCKDGGIAEVSIDDGTSQNVVAGNDRKNMPRYMFLTDDLDPGPHSLTLRVSDRRPAKSQGTAVRLMQVLVR